MSEDRSTSGNWCRSRCLKKQFLHSFQTERSPFFLTLGGQNRRMTRLSPGLPENVKKSVRAAAFIPVSSGAPTGFALERLRDAKRVYETTTTGRARDARQELHHAERARAPQR